MLCLLRFFEVAGEHGLLYVFVIENISGWKPWIMFPRQQSFKTMNFYVTVSRQLCFHSAILLKDPLSWNLSFLQIIFHNIEYWFFWIPSSLSYFFACCLVIFIKKAWCKFTFCPCVMFSSVMMWGSHHLCLQYPLKKMSSLVGNWNWTRVCSLFTTDFTIEPCEFLFPDIFCGWLDAQDVTGKLHDIKLSINIIYFPTLFVLLNIRQEGI